jgi:hypothetical protein
MDLHATTLEVILIAGVGAYIGFLIGLRWGIHLGATGNSDSNKTGKPRPHGAKSSSKKSPTTSAT